jgi:hypothetical protein
MKCMGQDMNMGVPPGNQFTVHPNLTVFHRNPPSPEHSANQNPWIKSTQGVRKAS